MKLLALIVAVLLPAIGYADAMNENVSTQPSLKMLLFVIGSITSVLFIKGRQNADYHTGYTPVVQSVIISVCFIWVHYILLVVDEQSLWEFYSNSILHINKSFVGLLCVAFLYAGFIAVIYWIIKIASAKIKSLRA